MRAQCRLCRELTWAFWAWSRLQDRDRLMSELMRRWNLDLASAIEIANVVEASHRVAEEVMRVEDAVEALEILERMPVVVGERHGIHFKVGIFVEPELRRMLGMAEHHTHLWKSVFVPLNPDRLLEAVQGAALALIDAAEDLRTSVLRYLQREAIDDRLRERAIQKLNRIGEIMEGLRSLYDIVNREIRDPSGRFAPGRAAYQEVWRLLREYVGAVGAQVIEMWEEIIAGMI